MNVFTKNFLRLFKKDGHLHLAEGGLTGDIACISRREEVEPRSTPRGVLHVVTCDDNVIAKTAIMIIILIITTQKKKS